MKGLVVGEVRVLMPRWFDEKACVVAVVEIDGVWVKVWPAMKVRLALEYVVMLELAIWLLFVSLFVSMTHAVVLVLEMDDQM